MKVFFNQFFFHKSSTYIYPKSLRTSQKSSQIHPLFNFKMAPKKSKSMGASSLRGRKEPIEEICVKNVARLVNKNVITGIIVNFPDGVEFANIKRNIKHLRYNIFLNLKNLDLSQHHFYSLFSLNNTKKFITLRMYNRPYTFSYDKFSNSCKYQIYENPSFRQNPYGMTKLVITSRSLHYSF